MSNAYTNLSRRGLLLDVLAEMSSVERQLVAQNQKPWAFVPDDLIERWDAVFLGGFGLSEIGLSDDALVIFLDFDNQLEELVGELPLAEGNKADYIRNDEIWATIRGLADWTLTLLAELGQPEEPEFSLN
jgi:hypothetical protein